MKMPTNFTKRREELGLTQIQVAQAVGVRDQSVSNWERGVHEPRLTAAQMENLCNILQVDLAGLRKLLEAD